MPSHLLGLHCAAQQKVNTGGGELPGVAQLGRPPAISEKLSASVDDMAQA